ncbi:MAG: hypothetical protein ACLGI9_10425, partial [Thermoanaerobaculia bacterium]
MGAVRPLFRETARPLDWVRLRWTEGFIAFGLGRLDEAEAAYREVQRDLLVHGVLYSVALVSLDLALLLSRQGRTEELKLLATELMEMRSSGGKHRCVPGSAPDFEAPPKISERLPSPSDAGVSSERESGKVDSRGAVPGRPRFSPPAARRLRPEVRGPAGA